MDQLDILSSRVFMFSGERQCFDAESFSNGDLDV